MPGSNSRHWQWNEHLWLPLLGATARAAWYWLLAERVFASPLVAPGAHLPVWMVLVLLLMPGLLRVALDGRRGTRAVQVLAGLLGAVAAACGIVAASPGRLLAETLLLFGPSEALTHLPAAAPALTIALLLWLDGSRARWLRYDDAWRSTAIGVVALVLLALVPGPRDTHTTTALAMVAFLISNLLLLALLSARGTVAIEETRLNRRLRLSRSWLGALLTLVLLLLLAGWGIASLTDPALVRAVAGAMTAGLRWLGRLLTGGLVWLVYGVFALLEPLIRWLQSLTSVSPNPTAAAEMGDQIRQLAEESTRGGNAPAWLQSLTTALGVAATVAIATWLLLLAARKSRPGLVTAEEERESIFSVALLGTQLRSLFDRLRPESRRARYLPIEGNTPTDSVRRAYQSVLHALEQRHLSRAPGQTPALLGNRLMELLPLGDTDIAVLTSAYEVARYGGTVDATTAGRACDAAQSLVALLSALNA